MRFSAMGATFGYEVYLCLANLRTLSRFLSASFLIASLLFLSEYCLKLQYSAHALSMEATSLSGKEYLKVLKAIK